MRWNLVSSLAEIKFYTGGCVNRISLVRIDDDAKEARIGVDKFSLESNVQIMEDRCIIEIGQICHVFNLFKLPRVDLANFGGLEDLFLLRKIMTIYI